MLLSITRSLLPDQLQWKSRETSGQTRNCQKVLGRQRAVSTVTGADGGPSLGHSTLATIILHFASRPSAVPESTQMQVCSGVKSGVKCWLGSLKSIWESIKPSHFSSSSASSPKPLSLVVQTELVLWCLRHSTFRLPPPSCPMKTQDCQV